MDAAGLGITVCVEVYHVAVFIRDVEHTRRNHSADVEEFQRRLDRETVFLEFFNDVYFKDDDTLRTFQSLPDHMKNVIREVYRDISRHQAEYREEMLRHGIDLSISSSSGVQDLSLITNESSTKDGKRHRLKEKLKELVSRADLKWALFDKTKIEELLELYGAQTQHLRDILTLNLLREGNQPRMVQKDAQQKLRLMNVIARQKRATQTAPPGYGKLKATLEGVVIPSQDSAVVEGTLKQIPLDDQKVVIEVRSYDEKQRQDSDSGGNDHLKPIEQVTWLLQSDRESSWEEEDDLFTLRCVGFIDQPIQGRSLLCYELPINITGSPRTLHDLIHSHGGSNRTKPALGMRFRLAHRLCATLFQVHLSNWVHKNVWSRGIVVFERGPDVIPYLQGWGLARRTEDETQMAAETSVEANFYHHSQRWGQPVVKHEPIHDIYSLGVVLLEIGSWRTVSAEYVKLIGKFNKFVQAGDDLNSPGLFAQKHSALLKLANSRDLKSQMGVRYTEMARWCLEGAVAMADKDDEHSTCVIRAFREQVVAKLAKFIDM